MSAQLLSVLPVNLNLNHHGRRDAVLDRLPIGFPQQFQETQHAHGDAGNVTTLPDEPIEIRKFTAIDLGRPNSKQKLSHRASIQQPGEQCKIHAGPPKGDAKCASQSSRPSDQGATGRALCLEFLLQIFDLFSEILGHGVNLPIGCTGRHEHRFLHRGTFFPPFKHIEIESIHSRK